MAAAQSHLCLPHEHYQYREEQLPDAHLQFGNFGENLTSEGLLEGNVHVGDRLRIGSAEFVVTQPRMPCYKLGIRFSRPDIVKRFLESRRSGFYLAVSREGDVATGDAIEVSSAITRRSVFRNCWNSERGSAGQAAQGGGGDSGIVGCMA